MGLKKGDFALIRPPQAKNDQWGDAFGAKPIYLSVHDSRFCAALALRDWEIARPTPANERRQTPLFTVAGEPLRHDVIDRVLHDLLLPIMTPERASQYSPHSFRIGLACTLLASGEPPHMIQMLLRWKSTESMVAYARFNPEDYTQRGRGGESTIVCS
uniref:Tyr recombinase domain-containing protein n=1 Tax=Aureoumbra lagunensis TaxID=44058 RepID=A0A7S3K0L2_9STRA|mmetsp:Transcript_21260/g.27516  ORF Transcript_21260/g.27516 Transcript_21260/m.27516 type:complete len:158 (-) Transcript_21260:104-577(-)|eukprot:CAMPEP_0197292332 /NCGR_PEP_ID=MMETSP0890-20130614/22559_1 /TAXON_ID=44058 ORGANISM="Aureoumbra lagunensis, Strain CCMP1510" /NCGR_SAMPLE_ID=MMETSP0890 /ASSEMBLY_ACC=CAM_ASM_000533 /LENGTH=157 /DNA_ID=CAMNT_0042766135 /DNA_START=183 /DNA_END=656 /DNA_ORIENTATION=-